MVIRVGGREVTRSNYHCIFIFHRHVHVGGIEFRRVVYFREKTKEKKRQTYVYLRRGRRITRCLQQIQYTYVHVYARRVIDSTQVLQAGVV